jgi:hypothetical protein
MDDENEKPAVGYQKPPKHSQFQKGQSGNPAGRAKGSKNFRTVWREEMAQQVTVKENGVSKQVDVIRAVILALKNEAISNRNLRAILKIIDHSRDYADEDAAGPNENRLKSSEDDILKRFKRDLLAQHGVYPELDNDARTSGVS